MRLHLCDPADLSAPTTAELNAGIPIYGIDLAEPVKVYAFRMAPDAIDVTGEDITHRREITDGKG